MYDVLEKIYNNIDLSLEESKNIFQKILQGNFDSIGLTSILVSLRTKGESYLEIAGAASALLEEAKTFPIPSYSFGDIVGTGGDKANTINISTLSALTAASLGLKIAKHGNRSVSSKCGSFDLLDALKVPFNVEAKRLRKSLDKEGICFLFAPLFHTGVKHVMPVRTALKTKTIFNILGPLINPARPNYQMVGVYSSDLIVPMAKVLIELGLSRGIVVHGSGLDEIAPHGDTQVVEIHQGKMKQKIIGPETFGFKKFSLDKIRGGERDENLEISLNILSGNGTEEQKQMLAMNIAPLLLMDKKVNSLREGAEIAMAELSTDRVLKLTQRLAVNE